MNMKDRNRIAQSIASRLADARPVRHLIVIGNLCHTLVAVLFEQSWRIDEVRVHTLVQTLALPDTGVVPDFGVSLFNHAPVPAREQAMQDRIVEELSPFLPELQALGSPSAVALRLASHPGSTRLVRRAQKVAHAAARAGRFDMAIEFLQRCRSLALDLKCENAPYMLPSWELEERIRGDRESVPARLREWEDQTAAALKLTKLRQDDLDRYGPDGP